MARVEARKKVLADARAAKEATKKLAQKMATEEARKARLEKAKALQEERRRLEAEKKAQEEAAAIQGAQAEKEKEMVDLTGTIEHLKKIGREKHIEEQRAAQLAQEKIKEALRRKAEGPILEPREGSPKRPRQEDDDDLENIQADPPSTFSASSVSSEDFGYIRVLLQERTEEMHWTREDVLCDAAEGGP
ncbi:hypothetical protein L7F22_054732 [Adiantum nelumboides]|nr:hypothetical protein [Adiantum nelumboides]